MNADYFEYLNRIAADMDRAHVSPDATVGYDIIADALVWSDEYPRDIPGRLHEFDCVKLLLRYRATLLLGSPDDFFKPYWVKARELFPNWAGFCESRLNPTEQLQELYKHYREQEMRRLDRFDKAIERSKSSFCETEAKDD